MRKATWLLVVVACFVGACASEAPTEGQNDDESAETANVSEAEGETAYACLNYGSACAANPTGCCAGLRCGTADGCNNFRCFKYCRY